MNISLTPELEKYVQGKVTSGFYTSVSEVIRESLRLMHTYDELQEQRISELHHSILSGFSQLEAGHKIPAKKSYEKLKQKIQAVKKSHK